MYIEFILIIGDPLFIVQKLELRKNLLAAVAKKTKAKIKSFIIE